MIDTVFVNVIDTFMSVDTTYVIDSVLVASQTSHVWEIIKILLQVVLTLLAVIFAYKGGLAAANRQFENQEKQRNILNKTMLIDQFKNLFHDLKDIKKQIEEMENNKDKHIYEIDIKSVEIIDKKTLFHNYNKFLLKEEQLYVDLLELYDQLKKLNLLKQRLDKVDSPAKRYPDFPEFKEYKSLLTDIISGINNCEKQFKELESKDEYQRKDGKDWGLSREEKTE